MDGDIAPLPGIVEAAEEFGAAVYVDDAHASGVLGRNGRGHGRPLRAPRPGRRSRSGRCRKAVGVLGGYVAGSQALRDILIQRARPFLFSTSHPPAVVSRLSRGDPGHAGRALALERLWASTRRFKAELTAARLRHRPLGDADHAGHRRRLGGGDPLLRPAVRGGRLRDVGRLPDRRDRPGRACGRSSRPRRATSSSTGRSRRSTGSATSSASSPGDGGAPDPRSGARNRRDLPLDAHLHTDQSPDSDGPDRRLRGAGGRARDRRDRDHRPRRLRAARPGLRLHDATTTASASSAAPPSAGRAQGVAIRFGAELTYNRRWEADIRDAPRALPLRLHDRVRPRLADSPYGRRVSGVGPGALARRDPRARTTTEVIAAARSGLFDTIGHLDVVKRYLHPHVTAGDLARRAGAVRADPAGARRVSGTALEVNTSGLRHPGRGDVPVGGGRGPLPRARRGAGDGRLGRPSREALRVGPRRRLRHRRSAGFERIAFRDEERALPPR